MHAIDLPKQEKQPSDPDVSLLHHHDESILACEINESHTFPQTDSVQAKGGVRNISDVRFDTGHLNDVCKELLANLRKAIMLWRCIEGKVPR
jgi:hypothetical protein